jgi:hypothetical protein
MKNMKKILMILIIFLTLNFITINKSFATITCTLGGRMDVEIQNGTAIDAWNILKKKYFSNLPINNPGCKKGDKPPYSTVHGDINFDRLIFEDTFLNGALRRYSLIEEYHTQTCYDDGFVKNNYFHGYYKSDMSGFEDYGALLICTETLSETLTLQLIGSPEIRPVGTGGASSIGLSAKIMSGTQPKSGAVINFAVDVVQNSGGHTHHDASRPKGSLSKLQGTTDANGEVRLVFTAPEVAGIHSVQASCTACSNSPARKEVQVKVPDLVNIFTMPFRDAQWAYPSIGETQEHADHHYLTVAAATRMLGISQKFQKIWPNAPKLTLNDASLVWGGKFDIPGTWERNPNAHAEHRIGENIDVRANSAPGAVPANLREAVFRWLRKTSRPSDMIPPDFVIDDVNPLREGIGSSNEHFHLRLGN